MNFEEYQKLASQTAIYLDKFLNENPGLPDRFVNYLGLSYTSNGLGEVGEIQGKVKKILRDQGGIITDENREDLKKELGDVLWYVSAMCSELGLSLDEVAESNIDKLFDRKKRNKLEGSGDNR